ncbi:MAG TPA: hypothetical protein PKC19_22605, partial [Roseiflexaceae bacterium]|nr:hypothetical protein [Roseiflexaceae bacterium]
MRQIPNRKRRHAALPFHLRLLVAAWRIAVLFAQCFLVALVLGAAALAYAYQHYGRDLPDPT